jgi:hypothetical protein
MKKEILGVFPYVSYHMWYVSTEKVSAHHSNEIYSWLSKFIIHQRTHNK